MYFKLKEKKPVSAYFMLMGGSPALQETMISVIYSSDLKRAHETAEIIASSCGDLEVIKDPDLRGRHPGDLQGISLSEAAKSQPLAYKAFLSDRNDQVIPGGGESLDQLYQRCTSCLQRIAKKHRGKRVVVGVQSEHFTGGLPHIGGLKVRAAIHPLVYFTCLIRMNGPLNSGPM